MKEILTRCGYRCDLCLAYKETIEKDDRRVFLSDTWDKIYGFRIPAEQIFCEGCMTTGTPKLIDNNCPVRLCVIKRKLDNCSQCEEYPCEIFNQRKVCYEDFTKNKEVADEEYVACIRPYENKKRLDSIRSADAMASDTAVQ